MASGWPVTRRLGVIWAVASLGLLGSTGITSQLARSIARSTTCSRACPASMTVRDSPLGGFVGCHSVAAYHRARRQPLAADARTTSAPSPSK